MKTVVAVCTIIGALATVLGLFISSKNSPTLVVQSQPPPQIYVTPSPQVIPTPTNEQTAPVSAQTAQSQDDGRTVSNPKPIKYAANRPSATYNKKQYRARSVGINTEQGLINNVLHRKAKIEACISHNKNMGNGFQDLLSKQACLEEMIAAVEYLEDNAYEIRTVVGGNQDAVAALQYIPYKSSFKAEMQTIENTLGQRRQSANQ